MSDHVSSSVTMIKPELLEEGTSKRVRNYEPLLHEKLRVNYVSSSLAIFITPNALVQLEEWK